MAMETWSPLQGPSYGGFGPNLSIKPPGEGWSITGYKSQQVQTSNSKMGSGMKTIQIPIYTRQTQDAPVQQQQAPVQEEAPAPKQEQTVPETKPSEEPKTSPMQDVASQIASSISDMQSGFQQQLQQQAAQFAAIQKAQEERMAALQQQMQQSAAAEHCHQPLLRCAVRHEASRPVSWPPESFSLRTALDLRTDTC